MWVIVVVVVIVVDSVHGCIDWTLFAKYSIVSSVNNTVNTRINWPELARIPTFIALARNLIAYAFCVSIQYMQKIVHLLTEWGLEPPVFIPFCVSLCLPFFFDHFSIVLFLSQCFSPSLALSFSHSEQINSDQHGNLYPLWLFNHVILYDVLWPQYKPHCVRACVWVFFHPALMSIVLWYHIWNYLHLHGNSFDREEKSRPNIYESYIHWPYDWNGRNQQQQYKVIKVASYTKHSEKKQAWIP